MLFKECQPSTRPSLWEDRICMCMTCIQLYSKACTSGEKVGAIISHNVDVAGYTSAPRRHASVPRRHPLRNIACHFNTRYEAPSYDQ